MTANSLPALQLPLGAPTPATCGATTTVPPRPWRQPSESPGPQGPMRGLGWERVPLTHPLTACREAGDKRYSKS